MGEHGLPVKHLADGDAIKATDELFIYPRFDRVRVAEFMEFAIGGLYLGGDPRSWLIPARRPGVLTEHFFPLALAPALLWLSSSMLSRGNPSIALVQLQDAHRQLLLELLEPR